MPGLRNATKHLGAVRVGCADPYAETAAYVARILALLDGAGAMLVPPLEVRLVR